MKIGTKIILAVLATIALTVCAIFVVQHRLVKKNGVESTVAIMRAAILEAENVRESISSLGTRGAFDRKKLLAEFKASGDLRGSTLYRTIPVVAAWESIAKVAEHEGFVFRVPKTQARNPKNNPSPLELELLKELESNNLPELIRVDEANNLLIYARPIKLSADCLACHGDPATSPTGDGKDILGFAMENWKAGEIHGAFVLQADMARVDRLSTESMKHSLGWMLPITLGVAVGFFFLNRRIIINPLRAAINGLHTASEQTTSTAGEISNASQSLAAGASEQAASLEETSASLEEISSMTRRNNDHAQNAKQLAQSVRNSADQGTQQMDLMVGAMKEIQSSSGNIAKIIKTIDEIAFQTNLLALNAAVEAARAGEAGMGFAVVADEVRILAQRAALAARETSEKIDDSIQKTNAGAHASLKVADSLRAIADQARRTDEIVAEIATASQEQLRGIEQVNSAVANMDKVTQSNAAAAEQSAAAAEELNAQSVLLRDNVSALATLAGEAAHRAQAALTPSISTPSFNAPAKPRTSPKPGHDFTFEK